MSSILSYLLPRHRIDGLVQERRNSSALAMNLRLSCTNASKYYKENNVFLSHVSATDRNISSNVKVTNDLQDRS